MRTTSIVIGAAIALSGCGTTATGESYVGKPYMQPTATEPSAEIVISKEQTDEISLEIFNTDERGCYSGKLTVPYAKADAGKVAGYRVHADKKLVLHYESYFRQEGRYSSKTCRGEFYFYPKKDAKYSIVPGQVTLQDEKASALSQFLYSSKRDYCTVSMIEETADGISTVPLRTTHPKQRGITCIQF